MYLNYAVDGILVVVAGTVVWGVRRTLRTIKSLKAQLVEARSQLKGASNFLSLFTRSLATVSEVDHTMKLVAQYVGRVLGAESVAVFEVVQDPSDSRQKLGGLAVSGPFPPFHYVPDIVRTRSKYVLEHLRHELIPFGEGVLGKVAERQENVLISDVATYSGADELPEEVRTLMAVPMFVGKKLCGVICAINARSDKQEHFQDADLRMLEHLSFQVAVAMDLINIYSERSEQQRIMQELQFGRDIQRSLLPASLPQWDGYEFAAFSHSALEVAGDYYDFVDMGNGRLMAIVADATGKGVPACLLMAMCRAFVRSLAENYAGLEKFLEDLNQCLYRDTDKAHFLTMAVVVIDRRTNVCEYACAGHTPLLLRMPDGTTRLISPDGPAVGLLPNDLGISFDTLSFCFDPGTSLLLFTDGLNEALNEQGQEFGMQRLQNLWHNNQMTAQELADLILREVNAFTGDEPQADDQTLMVISRPITDAS